MATVLHHFSEDPGIERFEPRAVIAQRPPGREWLNGPLVWAIDDWHAPMYFFPRDCPRILIWPLETTTIADRERWFGDGRARMVAHVEEGWVEPLRSTPVFRYILPATTFENVVDAGMWVSRDAVDPLAVEPVGDLLEALREAEVELRVLPSLLPLRDVWQSSLHASGIRLRNARGWTP